MEPLLAVAEPARIAVVEDQRRAAQVVAVDHASQVAAVAHRHDRQGDHRQIPQPRDALAGFVALTRWKAPSWAVVIALALAGAAIAR